MDVHTYIDHLTRTDVDDLFAVVVLVYLTPSFFRLAERSQPSWHLHIKKRSNIGRRGGGAAEKQKEKADACF